MNFTQVITEVLREEKAKITCDVCFQRFHARYFFRSSSLCNHEPTTCRACTEQYITAQLSSNAIPCKCVHHGCNREVQSHVLLTNGVNQQIVQKLERSLTLKYVKQLAEWRECPRAACSAGQLCANGNEKPCITCQGCCQQYCYRHKMPWHVGLTCEQYEASLDVSAIHWVRQHGYRCPNCGHGIQKIDGCNNMICDNRIGGCGTSFVYRGASQ